MYFIRFFIHGHLLYQHLSKREQLAESDPLQPYSTRLSEFYYLSMKLAFRTVTSNASLNNINDAILVLLFLVHKNDVFADVCYASSFFIPVSSLSNFFHFPFLLSTFHSENHQLASASEFSPVSPTTSADHLPACVRLTLYTRNLAQKDASLYPRRNKLYRASRYPLQALCRCRSNYKAEDSRNHVRNRQ